MYNDNNIKEIVEYYDRLGTICGLFFVIVIGLIGALLSLF